MKTNRADRLADALSMELPDADRRTLLELSEPEKFIAKAMQCRPGYLIRDACIPAAGNAVGSSVGALE